LWRVPFNQQPLVVAVPARSTDSQSALAVLGLGLPNNIYRSLTMSRDRDTERWKKANPYVLLNTQNSQARSGRFPSLEDAVEEAERRGGAVAIKGNTVLFSEMPSL
jgi:hypothetical protein